MVEAGTDFRHKIYFVLADTFAGILVNIFTKLFGRSSLSLIYSACFPTLATVTTISTR